MERKDWHGSDVWIALTVEYIRSLTGPDDISPDDIEKPRNAVGLPKDASETDMKFAEWMMWLPEDIKKKLAEKYAGNL